MAIATSTAILASAGILGGAAIYSASQSPGTPNVGPAPPPANYFSYDEDGNLASSQVWDEARGGYVSRINPEPEGKPTRPKKPWGPFLSSERINKYNDEMDAYPAKLEAWKESNPEWQAWKERKDANDRNKQVRGEIKDRMLANLNETPEDRLKAYDDYEKTYSEVLHKNVDEQYAKVKSSDDARLESQGLTGSKAQVDIATGRTGEKLKADVDIAQASNLAKEDLSARDRNYWLNLLQYSDTKASADELAALRKTGQAAQIAAQGTAAKGAQYTAESSNLWSKWAADVERNTARTNAFSGLSSSLGMAAAYGGGGDKGSTLKHAPTYNPNDSSAWMDKYGL